MKRLGLGSKGFAHIALPLLVVGVVAIGGTYMLVSSHADTPSTKKAKPRMIITDVTVLDDEFSVSAKLQRPNGLTVSKANCNGEFQVVVSGNRKRVSLPVTSASWSENACHLDAWKENMDNSPGKYTVKILYKGNDHYKSASKVAHRTIDPIPPGTTIYSTGDQ